MKFCYPSCINTLEQSLIDLNLFGRTYLKSSLSYLTRLLLNIPESKKVEVNTEYMQLPNKVFLGLL